MRFPLFLALLATVAVPLAVTASAQDATQDVRLRLVRNDAAAGGDLVVAVEVRTASRGANNSLGSATIDVDYDAAEVAAPTFTFDDAFFFAGTFPLYNQQFSPTLPANADPSQGRILISGLVTSGNEDFDVNVGEAWVSIGEMTFPLTAAGATSTALVVSRATLSVGYYDSPANGSGNGVIEDNTGTVGDDVVAFTSIGDLSTRTMALDSGEAWYLVGPPGAGASVGDLLGPIWTQGYPGSDADEEGAPSVMVWDETAGAYAPPASQTSELPAGAGVLTFVFADDDADGSDDPFPKTSTVAVDPVGALGGPVNNTAPDPFMADLPFAFGVTYTPDTGGADGPGWNLLANPTTGAVTWDAGWTRANVSAAFATWEPDAAGGPQYLSWSAGVGGTRADGLIDPFEGFWTQALADSPSLVMDGAALVPVASPREEAPTWVRLELAGEVGGVARGTQAVVAFSEGATAGLDPADAPELVGPASERLHLASAVEGTWLDVDVRPLLADEPAEVRLGVEAVAPTGGMADLVLTWPEVTVPDDVPLSLLDTETGTVVDLRGASEYAFQVGIDAASGRMALAAPRPRSLEAAGAEGRRSPSGRFVLYVGMAVPATALDAAEEVAFGLALPAPNPTADQATLRYALAAAGPARLVVYDVLGREVAVLADGPLAAGSHEHTLVAAALAPGVYVVRLTAGSQTATRTLTVAR